MSELSERPIRRLSAGDVFAYKAIRLEALKVAPEAFASTYDSEVARDDAHFENRVETGCVFGAFVGDRVVGMAGFYQESGKKSAHKGVLWGMYVTPEWRHAGFGHALVSAVLDHARGRVDLVNLYVVTENTAALDLYRKAGFREYGVEARAFKLDDRYVSETFMVCDLDG
ncbi:MAG: GNAT family N-acetyltransferase [Pseudomonadota bacterium]